MSVVTRHDDSSYEVASRYGYIDPELVPALEALPTNPFGTDGFGVAEVRAINATIALPELPADPGIGCRDIRRSADGPALRIIAPESDRPGRPCIFWIHGGGFVVGSPFDTDLRLFRWASEHDCVVVAVEYGLAPEHPYPQGLEDCYAGLVWTWHHADELGINPAAIAVAGESAGGGLAAALALVARDRREVEPCFQLLIYPMLDDRTVDAVDQPDTPVWTKAANAAGWVAYLGGDQRDGTSVAVTAAPGRAAPAQLKSLPACLISVGSEDLFRAENVAYAAALQAAAVPTDLHVYAGAFHGSDHLVPEAAVSRRFERDLDVALGRAFAQVQRGR